MSPDGSDHGSTLFFIGAATLVILMAWRGWRLGIVRQALSLGALALGYAAGFFLGKFFIPVLRPLGFPDRILTIIGAVLVGLVIYIAAMIVVGVLFKRTGQQSVGLVKLGFGASGALLGAAFGVFLVLVCVIAIRLMGSIADSDPRPTRGDPPPNRAATEMARMKRSLEHGPAGALIEKVDPVPGKVYDTLSKVGRMAGQPESIDRFANDREVARVAVHPKILALRDDPEVQRAIRDGDYLALLRNPKLVEAANDPAVLKLLGTFDLQKALDHSLRTPQKPPAR